MSDDTWNNIGKRKIIKASLIQRQDLDHQIFRSKEYRATDKEMKDSARNDQRNLIEWQVVLVEEAVERGSSKAVHKITNEIIFENSSIQHGLGILLGQPDNQAVCGEQILG